MSHFSDIPVFIAAPTGKYLSRATVGPVTTSNPTEAVVYHYIRDNIAAILDQAQKKTGRVWTAVPVPQTLIYETCDACGVSVDTTDTHFDGSRFLCPACHVP